jgi:ATP-dependent protease HslVU (ClpYQ) peptidase subunit
MMLVADREKTLVLTGTGDVLEPERDVMGIGSGGNYALAAARALLETEMGAEDIARGDDHCGGDLRLHQQQSGGRNPRERAVTYRVRHWQLQRTDGIQLI